MSFFVIKAGVNLEDVNIMKKNCQASLPVDLGHKMLIVLRIRVGYEGARSNMAFREHLVFFNLTISYGIHLKSSICNDLEGHDVVAIGRYRRWIEAVLAFGDLNSVVINHLPGWIKDHSDTTKTGPVMLQDIFHRLCWMNPVVDSGLFQKTQQY